MTIDYVAEPLAVPADDPAFAAFASVFEKFSLPKDAAPEEAKPTESAEQRERRELLSDEDEEKPEDEEEKPQHSKARLRRLNRLTVAELKQLVKKPEVVEVRR